MSEMRKCKECGKMFMPKGREQYCHDVHYRPCPVCGEPVIAKYLSDPPRRCDKCKKGKSNATQNTSSKQKSLFSLDAVKEMQPFGVPAVKPMNATSSSHESTPEAKQPEPVKPITYSGRRDTRLFIGNPNHYRLNSGHEYAMKIDKEGYVYRMHIQEDVTTGEPIDVIYHFASQISIAHNFRPTVSF